MKKSLLITVALVALISVSVFAGGSGETGPKDGFIGPMTETT